MALLRARIDRRLWTGGATPLTVVPLVAMLLLVACTPPVGGPSLPASSPPASASSPAANASASATATASATASAAGTAPAGSGVPVSVRCGEGLQTINASVLTVGNDVARPGFRVCAPARYLATTAEMMTPYLTQGGTGGPPQLLLNVGTQPLASDDQWRTVLRGSDDCVAVWWTRGFDIAQFRDFVFNQILSLDAKPVADPQTGRQGAYEVQLQDVLISGARRPTAYLRVGAGAFYLTTCGDRNTTDFNRILASLEIRER
jgi:hypothetical protein